MCSHFRLFFPFFPFPFPQKNFKTCDQSGFCRRNRRLADNPPAAYHLVPDTVNVQLEDAAVNAQLVNPATKVLYNLEVFVADGTARVVIDEASPIRPRYRVQDVIVGTWTPATATIDTVDDKTTISFGSDAELKVVLTHAPFRIDFFRKDDLVMSLNSRGLFNMEHQRIKVRHFLGKFAVLF